MHTKFFSQLACTKETGMKPNRACSRALMSCVACIFAFYKRAKRKRRRWTDDSIYFFRRCMFPRSSFFFFCEQLCGSYATQGYERMKWWQSVQFHPTNLCSFTSISAIQTIEEDREPIPEKKTWSTLSFLAQSRWGDSWSTSTWARSCVHVELWALVPSGPFSVEFRGKSGRWWKWNAN